MEISLAAMIMAVLWTAVGITCGIIAGRQGRNAAAWLAMGVLFSVAALIVLLLTPAPGSPEGQSNEVLHAERLPPGEDDNPLDGRAGEYLALGAGIAGTIGLVIFLIYKWSS